MLNSEFKNSEGGAHPLSQVNSITHFKNVVLAIKEDTPFGCDAFLSDDSESIEIKWMYVSSEARGQRIGEEFLFELEN